MIKNIRIEKIAPHPGNPRQSLGDLSELAESIRIRGILQNLAVVPVSEGPAEVRESNPEAEYIAVIGHRRLAAAKLAGLEEVPCAVSGMTFQEQIETMMIENIQRGDLTVWEEARGFQMMMDLGGTVGSIAEKTGFSETTVRRRVELAELDPKRFKEASDRGATLMDFAELAKIKDTGLRNEALDKIGTPDFMWAVKKALDKEEAEKNKAAIIAGLEKFAARADEDKISGLSYVRTYFSRTDRGAEAPGDAGSAKYFFIETPGRDLIYLYSDRAGEAQSEAGIEKAREAEETRARLEALREAEERARELRGGFIRGFTDAKAKKQIAVIAEYAARVITGEFWFYQGIFNDILNIDSNADSPEPVFESSARKPEYLLLAAAYASANGPDKYSDYHGRYTANSSLDFIYGFLERLGYAASDEENALRRGSHELYTRPEN